MKKVFSLLLLIIISFSIFSGCKNIEVSEKNSLSIVATIFPYYDFAREIAGDKAEVEMLVSPGAESHDYEPSPQDIIKINNADLFIYNGGESDSWVQTIIDTIESDVKVLCMFDYIEPLCTEHNHSEDEHSEEHQHQDEEHNHSDYDEHIWTSPINSVKLVEAIASEVINVDKSHEDLYINKKNIYIDKLNVINNKITSIVNKSNKNTLVFADRFPMLYFTSEYGIQRKSAFSGCTSETQPSIKTVTEIIDFVNENNIPVIFHIDNSNENFARLVSEDTGAKVRTMYSCHYLTKEQFENKENYLSLMEKNIVVLKEAL